MKAFKQTLFLVFFGISSIYAADNLKLFAGLNVAGTDSIYETKHQDSTQKYLDTRRYGYEGHIGGRFGVEYFFTHKNGIRGFLGLGYANIRLIDGLDKFILYSGISSTVEVNYLYNYYSDGKFDFGLFGGPGYSNIYHKKESITILTNQFFIDIGLNMTICSRHRIEIGFGIPIYLSSVYHSSGQDDIYLRRDFKNLYYSISYIFLFSAF